MLKAVLSFITMLLVLCYAVPGFAYGTYGKFTVTKVAQDNGAYMLVTLPKKGHEIPRDLSAGLASGKYFEVYCFSSRPVQTPQTLGSIQYYFQEFVKSEVAKVAGVASANELCGPDKKLSIEIVTPIEKLKCYATKTWLGTHAFFPPLQALTYCVR